MVWSVIYPDVCYICTGIFLSLLPSPNARERELATADGKRRAMRMLSPLRDTWCE